MKSSIPRTFYAGLMLYTAIFTLATVPLFPSPLTLQQLSELAIAAGLASGIVVVLLLLGLSTRMGDLGAGFTQALLGIGICTGLYPLLNPGASPLVMVVGSLWVAVSVSNLSAKKTLTLLTAYFALYGYAAYPYILDTGSPMHRDALYAGALSLVITALLYWRAHDYEHHADEKVVNAQKLEEASEQVRTLTTYDPDTTALKQTYFVAQVLREKVRVEHEAGTFSIGLIEIDHFEELAQRLGRTAAKQLLREFSERAVRHIRQTDALGAWPRTFQPLGRLSDGRFGLLLPSANYEAAMKCAQRLHDAVDFKSIRTAAGVVGITLSIGITEYVKNETLEGTMQLAERALKMAKSHNGNDFRGVRRVSAA